jgi:hypothetical protein
MRIVIVIIFLVLNSPALAGSIITVQTAAHIPIMIAASIASRFQGFIEGLISMGYTPRHIGCYARGGHVSGSRHYSGAACDFDQRGWGKTVPIMYTDSVDRLAKRYGLRNGRSFRDAGHIDDGERLRRTRRRH